MTIVETIALTTSIVLLIHAAYRFTVITIKHLNAISKSELTEYEKTLINKYYSRLFYLQYIKFGIAVLIFYFFIMR